MAGNHPSNGYNIVTAPIDKRPIGNEYLYNLISMGGDSYYTVDKSNLDQGPTSATSWDFGDVVGVQNDFSKLISTKNTTSTIGIINTPSYIHGGLVASRMPDKGYLKTNGLNALNTLTSTYTHPYYYVHIPMPRTIPDPRFPYPSDNNTDKGMAYFYWRYQSKPELQSNTKFSQLLLEWAYVAHKELSGYTLEPWENDFKNYFEYKYYYNPTTEFKYNDIGYAKWYKKLFTDACDLIKEIMSMQKNGQINEVIVGVDDITLPSFYAKQNIYTQSWVPKDSKGNPIKFSWSLHNLNACKLHHTSLYSSSNVSLGEVGDDDFINYIAGTDEIPQLIYARDITRRTDFATKIEIDYSLDRLPNDSKTYQGPYDLFSTEELMEQRINFLKKRGHQVNSARIFRVFIHNWDIYTKPLAKNKFYTNAAGNPEQAAIDFANAVFKSFNNSENVGVLDLGTNKVDWELFKALDMVDGNMKTQLACYSGWNTIGNAIGLGLAHAQVFGILDYYDATIDMWRFHAKILAQHLLEDGIYNTKIKINTNLLQSQKRGYMDPSEHFAIASDTWERLSGDDYSYIINQFINSLFPMRLAGNDYTWSTSHVKPKNILTASELYNVTGHPWNRTFECIITIDII